MSPLSLALASSLVLVAIAISRHQQLNLESDLIVGTVRATLQLIGVGFILRFVFGIDDWRLTTLILLLMIVNASLNAAKRGKGIPNIVLMVMGSIACGSFFTLIILITVGAISYRPSEVIPVSGMIVGNAMVASSLTINRLREEVKTKRLEIEARLALGATPGQAVSEAVRLAIRTGMIPTVDSMKTLGIVQLPGMMTGLILAGVSPLEAIKYQLMVSFMLSAAVAIACMFLSFMLTQRFFKPGYQLNTDVL